MEPAVREEDILVSRLIIWKDVSGQLIAHIRPAMDGLVGGISVMNELAASQNDIPKSRLCQDT